jgi:hypothetical protein
MGVNMARVGAPESLAIVVPFLVITLLNLVMTVLLLQSIDVRQKTLQPA